MGMERSGGMRVDLDAEDFARLIELSVQLMESFAFNSNKKSIPA